MAVAKSLASENTLPELITELEVGNFGRAEEAAKCRDFQSVDADQVSRVVRLLIEGGYYEVAVQVGQKIAKQNKNKLTATTGKVFATFASFFTTGSFDDAVAGLELILDTKECRNHETLRGRTLDLLGRTVALGVSFRLVPDEMILRARHLIGEATKIFARNNLHIEHARALQALAQMHCSGAYPDLISSTAVLRAAYDVSDRCGNIQIKSEVARRTAELECLENDAVDLAAVRTKFASPSLKCSESALDGAAYVVSLARVLRNKGIRASDELDTASKVFEARGYWSGLYEVTSSLATTSLEQGHYARALRKFRELLELASRMGFTQGMAVAQLGLFQVHVALGEADQAKTVAQSLLKLSKSPAIAGSLGLSMAAAFQLLGDLGKALEVSRGTSRLFGQKRLFEMQSQALFVEGSCLAGLNRWNEALRVWRRAAKIDEEIGNFTGQADKLIACAQAEVMHDLVENNKVSEISLARAMRVLKSVSKSLVVKGVSDGRLRAKIHQTEAQLCVVTRDMMRALKSYSAARDELVRIGAMRDVAFVDAQVGLALLDLGRAQYPHMLDEALDSFRRSLEYCNAEQVLTLRWKVQYYLAFGCFLVSSTKGSEAEAGKWQEAAREWLKAARLDVHALQEHGSARPPIDGDFSPSLSFDVLDTLHKELQPKSSSSKKNSQGLVLEMRTKDKGGQWH